ncbi:hypothetical protein ACFQU7_29240 [Pseudoroseomonas wenyumeiae]
MLDERRAEAVYRVVKDGGVRAAAEVMRVDPAAISRYLAKAASEVGLPCSSAVGGLWFRPQLPWPSATISRNVRRARRP